MTRALFPVLLLAACARGEAPPADGGDTTAADDSIAAATAVADTALPAMPDYPAARRAHLVAHAVGALDTDVTWPAWAGRCDRPPMLVVIADEPRSGASVLLHLPSGDSLTGSYPISAADSGAPPVPPAAQLGFQFFETSTADVYQSADGVVEVSRLSPNRVSGRFAVTIQHVGDQDRARVAGVFAEVPVRALPPDWCERAAAAQDSVAALPRDSVAERTGRNARRRREHKTP